MKRAHLGTRLSRKKNKKKTNRVSMRFFIRENEDSCPFANEPSQESVHENNAHLAQGQNTLR